MTTLKESKFKPGQSGNPAGRPPGSGWSAKARDALQKDWPAIQDVLVKKAKDGDIAAIRIVAERICPALKPTEAAITFDMHDGTLTDRATSVLKALGAGELAPTTGAQLLAALGSVAKVIETDEIMRRLAALEEKK